LVNSSYSPLEKMTRVILEFFGVRQLAAAFFRRKLASGGLSSKLERQKRQQAAALQTVYYSKRLTPRAGLLLSS
jgi:hypothetical protein